MQKYEAYNEACLAVSQGVCDDETQASVLPIG
jgi:hypothetical protein